MDLKSKKFKEVGSWQYAINSKNYKLEACSLKPAAFKYQFN